MRPIIVGIAGAATAVILQRSRRRRKDGSSIRDDASCTSSITSVSHQLMDLPESGGLEPVLEESDAGTHRRRWRRTFCLGLDQLLLLTLALSALGLAIKREAWDVTGLLALGLVIMFISHIIHYWRKTKRAALKAAKQLRDMDASSMRINDRQAPASPPVAYSPDLRLIGTWVKDNKSSDQMNTACDIMQLNGVVRLAVSLVKGVELSIKPIPDNTDMQPSNGTLANGTSTAADNTSSAVQNMMMEMAVFSVVSWFKVRERYALNGPSSMWNRRDLRKGKHVGRASVLPDGGLRLDLEWGAPLAGRGYDEFRLENPDELHVTSHIEVGTRRHTYTLIYRRRK